MPSLDHALTFETIKRHYRRAERAIKRCDSLADAVPTPALNQLRYAGYHILVAILADKAGDAAKTARELLEAEEQELLQIVENRGHATSVFYNLQ